ncbi:MAG: hypothetical protein H0T73_00365 [Ardenticatenales bacterium]|nr:hypothetical protein [Ardenticatenales bacterium]
MLELLSGHFLVIFLLLLVIPLSVRAQGPNRAGLVIQYGDGQIETACVSFEEAEISGFELLQRSGLPMTYDAQAGTLVCSIGNEGCFFPTDGCLCQCSGVGTCIYWSYHFLDEGRTWQYSQLGAAATKVRPGQVNGWRWGVGGANSAPPPGDITFERICSAPAPVPATATAAPPPPTLASTATLPLPAATQAAVLATSSPVAAPTQPAPTKPSTLSTSPTPVSPTASVTATRTEMALAMTTIPAEPTKIPDVLPTAVTAQTTSASPTPYLIFALMVLVLGGGVLWARRG